MTPNTRREEPMTPENKELELREALEALLDQVDYVARNCSINDMVGSVLPREIISKCRRALEGKKP